MPITYVNGFPMLSADMNADWPLVPPPNSHVDSLEIFTDSHRQEMKVEVFYQREGFQLPLPQDVDDCQNWVIGELRLEESPQEWW